MKKTIQHIFVLAVLSPIIAYQQSATLAQAQSNQIVIDPIMPTELNDDGGGAPNATLEQAAVFAWQEFIAAVWPAVEQKGEDGNRDTADETCLFFGDPDPECAARLLVWETYRNKVEIFPGQGGVDDSYDALPTYRYQADVSSCTGNEPERAAWVNLDEADEITLAAMYAGVAPSKQRPNNSAPQLIRFLAKANRPMFDYAQALRKNGGMVGDFPGDSGIITPQLKDATRKFLRETGDPPPGGLDAVSLKNNTIEIKAGWRLLNPEKEDSSRFHTALVRYYEGSGDTPCFYEEVWGLVALHINQKTETAPYFIYATFEQADNILDREGRRVEDDDGRILRAIKCRKDRSGPCPRTPNVVLVDDGVNPPVVEISPAGDPYCTASIDEHPPNQLYYQNSIEIESQPHKGYVCVNGRDNPIPHEIVDVNAAAHHAIRDYNQKHGISDSPWLHYKLVNVQYKPIDKMEPGFFTGTDANSGNNPASYYLANIVVETNLALQLFSGCIMPGGNAAPNSDYESQCKGGFAGRTTHPNMFYAKIPHNMGGCMGCHGGQGQADGGDFSVILARGSVGKPELPPERTEDGAMMEIRNRTLMPPAMQ